MPINSMRKTCGVATFGFTSLLLSSTFMLFCWLISASTLASYVSETTHDAHHNTNNTSAKKIDPALKSALAQAVSDADSFNDEFDAQVWLVDMSSRLKRYIKNPKKRLQLLRMVHQEATRAGLSPELVISVIHVESAFNPYAVSYVGAQGLMQVMPFWKKELGRQDDNLINAATNLRYGCTILKHYLRREKGDWTRALARYNGSLGRTKYPEKVMNFWQKYWFVDHQ